MALSICETSGGVQSSYPGRPYAPGEILREDLTQPLGLSINRLARELHVPVNRVSEIVGGRRGITADTALRLARYFGTSAEFWGNLQSIYELQSASRDRAKAINREVRPRSAA